MRKSVHFISRRLSWRSKYTDCPRFFLKEGVPITTGIMWHGVSWSECFQYFYMYCRWLLPMLLVTSFAAVDLLIYIEIVDRFIAPRSLSVTWGIRLNFLVWSSLSLTTYSILLRCSSTTLSKTAQRPLSVKVSWDKLSQRVCVPAYFLRMAHVRPTPTEGICFPIVNVD